MSRMDPEHRKRLIIDAAMQAADEIGLYNFVAGDVAERADCSRALVVYHIGGAPTLRQVVISKAIQERVYSILVQAIAVRDPLVDNLDLDIRQAALEAMT